MKKVLSVFIIALFAVAMTACNKMNETEEMILGEWEETEVIGTITRDGVTSEPVSMLEPGETTTMTFKKNHTYTSIWHTAEGDVSSNGTWSAEDNTLTMSNSFGPLDYHIDALDKSSMVLTYTETGVDELGFYSTYIIMKLKKN